MSVLIGLDIGTTKIAAAALDAQNGKVRAGLSAPNAASLPGPEGVGEQDASVLVKDALGLLRRVAEEPRVKGAEVAAIGVTGQMHGIVLVDKEGRPQSHLITWQDERGNLPVPGGRHTFVEKLAARLGSDAVERSGCRPAAGYGGVTLLRLSSGGLVPEGSVGLTIQDLVVLALTGVAATDPTDAAGWGLLDVEHGGRWLEGAAEAAGVSPSVLPEVHETGAMAGALTPDAAGLAGLPSGTPVAVAMGDNQASFLGSVPSLRDTVLMNLGTGGQMSIPISRFVRVEGLETRPFVGGMRLLVGASLCGGRAYQVVDGFLRDVGREVFGIKAEGRLYERMNELAAAASEDAGGLEMKTLFGGTRLDPDAKGMLTGIGTDNLKTGNLLRAALKGMVGELVSFCRRAEEAAGREGTARPTWYIVGSGNAIRRNPVAREILEKEMRMRLLLPPNEEEAACGAALSAGVAAGVFSEWEEAVGFFS